MTRARPKPLSLPDGAELLNREMFMAAKLKAHGCDVFAGSSDQASRKACFRRVIVEHGLDCGIIGKDSAGHCLTYAGAFERTYGEPLEPKPKRGANSMGPSASDLRMGKDQ